MGGIPSVVGLPFLLVSEVMFLLFELKKKIEKK